MSASKRSRRVRSGSDRTSDSAPDSIRLLIALESPDDLAPFQDALRRQSDLPLVEVNPAFTIREFSTAIRAESFDVIVLDCRDAAEVGVDLILGIRNRGVRTPAILVTTPNDKDVESIGRIPQARAYPASGPLQPPVAGAILELARDVCRRREEGPRQ